MAELALRRRAEGRAVPAVARVRVGLLALLATGAVAAYWFTDLGRSWEYAVGLRAEKVAVMVLVAVAIGVSTVMFQTVTGNRILTPAIMGFDAIYVAVQSVIVFVAGSQHLLAMDPLALWAVQVGLMVAFSLLLFRWMLGRAGSSLHLLLLVGIVLGILLRSVTTLIQRMLDPAAFLVLQDASFASFSAPDGRLLAASALLVGVTVAACARMHRRLDVLVLGEASATALGLDHRRTATRVLTLVSLLVAASTSLVGPIAFLGLIVANLAYFLARTHRHAVTMPAAALLGVVFLLGGQWILERLLGWGTVLAVVIEFVGGVVFVALVLSMGRRRP